MTTQVLPNRSAQVDYSRLPRAVVLAAGISAIINTAIFVVGSALDLFPETVIIPAANQPMTVAPVIFATVFGVVAGAVVYAVLGRVVARPVQVFRILGIVVLVLSFGSPFSIPDAPAGMIAALLVMHIVAGAAAIGVLTTQAAKP
ncbi:MAG: DUF6069 family protein [bacterium]|nr:DUF6069 family protein [bacterium]